MLFSFSIDGLAVANLVAAVVLPVLVGLVTTRVTHSGKKAVLLAALSVATAMLTEAIDTSMAGNAYDIGQGLINGIGTFIVAVAVHYGLWKPTGTSGKVQDVGTKKKKALPSSDTYAVKPEDNPRHPDHKP